MDARGAAEPYSTFSAGSVEDALDLRLPADLKNRLRTACLPGPGPAAVEPPDADFLRGMAAYTRAGLRARGRTPRRLRARTPQHVLGAAWRGGAFSAQIGGAASLAGGGALAVQIGCAAGLGGGGALAAQVVYSCGCDFAPNLTASLASRVLFPLPAWFDR